MSARTPMVFTVAFGLAPLVACGTAGEQGAQASVDGGGAGDGAVIMDSGSGEGSAADGGNSCADGEMAAILAATNQAQVDATNQLRASLSDPRATALTEKMLTDHSLLLAQLQGQVRAGAIPTESSGIAQAIADSAARDRTAIAASASIDSAYADDEVLWHLRDQALLDAVIAPTVSSSRLAFVATSMQNIEKQHVALALALQAELDTTCH
jgi:predicted outer membrane protein